MYSDDVYIDKVRSGQVFVHLMHDDISTNIEQR